MGRALACPHTTHRRGCRSQSRPHLTPSHPRTHTMGTCGHPDPPPHTTHPHTLPYTNTGTRPTCTRSEKAVVTPTGHCYVGVEFCKRLCGVSIIRSGESMENALRACCKGIKIGKILVHR